MRFDLLCATDLVVFPLFHWDCYIFCRKSESRWRLFGWSCVCAWWQSFNWRHPLETRESAALMLLTMMTMIKVRVVHLEYGSLNVYARMSKMARI